MSGIYIGTTPLKAAYVGTTPVKEIYVGTTKVRPTERRPGANTVAYRPLNSTTTVNDQSGNNYNLTQTGGSFGTYNGVDCFYNGGSTTGYLTLTSGDKIPSSYNNRTISLWVNPTSGLSSYDRSFFSYGGSSSNSYLRLVITSDMKYGTMVNGLSKGNTMPTNTWSLLTFTVERNNGRTYRYFYVNGTLALNVSSSGMTTTAISSSYPLRLMRQNTSSSSNYQVNGYISEVIIEDKTWTADEISAYYNQNKSKYGLS